MVFAQVFVVEAEADVVLAGRREADVGIATIEAALGVGDVGLREVLLRPDDGGAAGDRRADVGDVVSARVRRDEVARILADAVSARQRQPVGDVAGVARDPVEAARLDLLVPCSWPTMPPVKLAFGVKL